MAPQHGVLRPLALCAQNTFPLGTSGQMPICVWPEDGGSESSDDWGLTLHCPMLVRVLHVKCGRESHDLPSAY